VTAIIRRTRPAASRLSNIIVAIPDTLVIEPILAHAPVSADSRAAKRTRAWTGVAGDQPLIRGTLDAWAKTAFPLLVASGRSLQLLQYLVHAERA
jgi:hypothetical protein